MGGAVSELSLKFQVKNTMDFTSFNVSTNAEKVTIVGLPESCPYCHLHIRPYSIYGYLNQFKTDLELLLACPNRACDKAFIGYYEAKETGNHPDLMKTQYVFSGKTNVGNPKFIFQSHVIESVSNDFYKIYNQANQAEHVKLLEICGVGYRKALEFLIKDYAISKNTDSRELIEKKTLMWCIDNYVDDIRVKSVAKRAAWLGNDETHYIRKWEGKNLEDLKKLIDLTVHWIEMEKLTESFEEDMPEDKK